MPLEKNQIIGAVLAGGKSERMQGKNKLLLPLAGQPLVCLVCQRLSAQLDTIVLNVNDNGQVYEFLDLPIIPDTISNHVGPLAGILAAMEYAKLGPVSAETRAILSVAADTPFFPEDLAEKLRKALNAEGDDFTIAMASSNDDLHPTFALWPLTVMQDLKRFLVEEKGRKMRQFASRFNLIEVPFTQTSKVSDPFFNINTPADYELARQQINRK